MAQAVENVRIRLVSSGSIVQITIVFVAYFAAGKLGQATANIRAVTWGLYGLHTGRPLPRSYSMGIGLIGIARGFLVAFLIQFLTWPQWSGTEPRCSTDWCVPPPPPAKFDLPVAFARCAY